LQLLFANWVQNENISEVFLIFSELNLKIWDKLFIHSTTQAVLKLILF